MLWPEPIPLLLSVCELESTLVTVFLQNLGLDWDERVLPSIGNEIVKAAVAQYNAEQLLTQRDRVSRAVSCCGVPSSRSFLCTCRAPAAGLRQAGSCVEAAETYAPPACHFSLQLAALADTLAVSSRFLGRPTAGTELLMLLLKSVCANFSWFDSRWKVRLLLQQLHLPCLQSMRQAADA